MTKEYTNAELIARETAMTAYASECANKVAAILKKIDDAMAEGADTAAMQSALVQAKAKQADAEAEAEAAKAECDKHAITAEDKAAIDVKTLTAALATGGVARYARYVKKLENAFKACDKITYAASVFGRVDCISADDDDAKRLAKDKAALAKRMAAEVSAIGLLFGLERYNASKAEVNFVCGGAMVAYNAKGNAKVKAFSANAIFSRIFTVAALRLNGSNLKEVINASLESAAGKELFAELKKDFPEAYADNKKKAAADKKKKTA